MASSLETTNLMILWLFTLQMLLTNYLLHILKIMRWTKKTIKPPGHSVSGLNVLFHTHKHHLINRFIWSWHHYFKLEIGNKAKTLNVKRKYWQWNISTEQHKRCSHSHSLVLYFTHTIVINILATVDFLEPRVNLDEWKVECKCIIYCLLSWLASCNHYCMATMHSQTYQLIGAK